MATKIMKNDISRACRPRYIVEGQVHLFSRPHQATKMVELAAAADPLKFKGLEPVLREAMSGKSALVFLFEGYEEIEAVSPIDILRRADVEVVVASISDSLAVKGRSNLVLQADLLLSSVPTDRVFDCVVVPGGPGTKLLRASPVVLGIVKRYHTPLCVVSSTIF